MQVLSGFGNENRRSECALRRHEHHLAPVDGETLTDFLCCGVQGRPLLSARWPMAVPWARAAAIFSTLPARPVPLEHLQQPRVQPSVRYALKEPPPRLATLPAPQPATCVLKAHAVGMARARFSRARPAPLGSRATARCVWRRPSSWFLRDRSVACEGRSHQEG